MKTKVTGYLTQKHGFYYVVLNLPTDEKGKRNRKTLSTGLSTDRNATKAKALLLTMIREANAGEEVRGVNERQPKSQNKTEDERWNSPWPGMLFSDYLEFWLQWKRKSWEEVTYSGYCQNVRSWIFNLNPLSWKDVNFVDKPVNQSFCQHIGVSDFLHNFLLFQLDFIITFYLLCLCSNDSMNIFGLYQFRVINRFSCSIGFQINLSKRILLIKMPLAVLNRTEFFFMFGLLDCLQIQFILIAINSQCRTHLSPNCFKYNLLQICHLYAHTMTRKRFSHLGMTAIKPRTIS